MVAAHPEPDNTRARTRMRSSRNTDMCDLTDRAAELCGIIVLKALLRMDGEEYIYSIG